MTRSFHPFLVKTVKVLAVLVCVWIVADFVLWWWFWRSFSVDYTAKPPGKVFKTVLNQDMPKGVSNLQVAGYGILMGHTVWMKFKADDAAISALLENRKLSFDGPGNSFTWVTKKQILQDRDARAIEWHRVLQLKQFHSYTYSFLPPGTGWSGEIIVDRANHTVYTYSMAM